MTKEIIEITTTIYSSLDEIWWALTDPDQTEDWWGEGVIIEPRVGGKFCEPWEDDNGGKQLASGKVISVTPKKEITFTWTEKNWPATAVTQCSIQISEEGNKQIVLLKHTGWETLPSEKRIQSIIDFRLGWTYHLKELKSYLED